MRLIKEEYLMDSYGKCLICEWQWDRVRYTKWHHLIEDHNLSLYSYGDEPMNAPFIWEIYQRVIR